MSSYAEWLKIEPDDLIVLGNLPPEFERLSFHLPGQHDQSTHGHRDVGGIDALTKPREGGILLTVEDLNSDQLQQVSTEVSNWEPNARRIGLMALRAYENEADEDTELIIRQDRDGKTTGVMELGKPDDVITSDDVIKPRDYLEVRYLASGKRGSGAGTALLEAAFEYAAASDRGVVLYSVEEAVDFYKALGGVKVPDHYNVFHWSPKKVKLMLERKGG